jgi:hypothetical protein
MFAGPLLYPSFFVNTVVILIVPDLASRIRDVVLVRRVFSSGKPRGVGNLEWGGDGKRELSLQATWDQVDGILSRQGGFPSK